MSDQCHSSDCDGPAWVRVHWVTGPVEVCLSCAKAFVVVAEVLGMAAPQVERTSAYEAWLELFRKQVLSTVPSKRHAQLELD